MDLYILGAGGHGRELHSYIEDLRRAGWNSTFRGYLDDRIAPGLYGSLNVLGSIAEFQYQLPAAAQANYLTAFGANDVRRRVVADIESRFGGRIIPWTLIHPLASVGEGVRIGAGSCLAPAAIVTAQTSIGSHCILNVKASVAHDCSIADFVNVNPGATVCGSVQIGKGAYIGAGAVVKDGVSIGAWSVIGAGAAVVDDIPPGVTAVGVPARIIRRHD